jgi:hypothetical protein
VLLFACLLHAGVAQAADLRIPSSVAAGQAFSIPTEGSGEATFYLLGPASVTKRSVKLGSEIAIASDDIAVAGQYQAILCTGQACESTPFSVHAGPPARLSFFLHPSRVPVSRPDAINGTAFIFDRYYNPVLQPAKVEFQISPGSGAATTRTVAAERGVTSLQLASSNKAGPVRIVASVANIDEPRVIQQVASEACALRMRATPNSHGALLETDPVRDCSGNPLPDGTIVSFTKTDEAGKTTIDAPIKKGVARAQVELKGHSQISVACGVVLGNEISVGGKT